MRSKRFWSATSTLAPESCRPYSISSVVHHPLRPTRTAPCWTVAQNVRHHSGLFWLRHGDAVALLQAEAIA